MSTDLQAPAPDESSSSTEPLADDAGAHSFAVYLAKRFVGDKGYQVGMPDEAADLLTACDVSLFYGAYGLALVAIVDREAHPERTFAIEQKRLIEIGKECLKYTGSVNGAKLPVQFVIYEVGSTPLSENDRTRLKSLSKTSLRDHVAVTTYHVDTSAKTVWCSARFNGFFAGRRWVERLLREPRQSDEQIFEAPAALPKDERKPVVTWSILGLLLAMFVAEHVLQIEGNSSGLLGLNVGTLRAMGGMNRVDVLVGGEWYRLLTAALLHGDVFHIVMNGLVLWMTGTMLESLVGRAWLLVLFLFGALGGSLMGLTLNDPQITSIGASGAGMALLAATFVLAWRLPKGAERSQVQVSMMQFLIPSLIPIATSRTGAQIDIAAHFGGAIAGMAAGYGLLKLWPRESEQPRFTKVANVASVLIVALFAACMVMAAKRYPALAEEHAVPPVSLLVANEKIPKEDAEAIRTVEIWGRGHERDPRVHMYRAMGLFDDGKYDAAESELLTALSEKKILKAYFPNGKLEKFLRELMADIDQVRAGLGRVDDPTQPGPEEPSPE